MNFIPKKSVENGSYLCTWHQQDTVMKKYGLRNIYGSGVRDALHADFLNEPAYHFLPEEYRSGLYFVLDDGWDVAPGTEHPGGDSKRAFGSVDPNPEKFGSLGSTPVERLKALCRWAEGMGYAGLGVWIAPHLFGEHGNVSVEEARPYWEERARWCQEAGVRYWKVDWGYHDKAPEYRLMMTESVRKYAPDLLIEHAYPQKPLTYPQDRAVRRQMSREFFACSDFFRSYDVIWPIAESATLSRLHDILEDPLPFCSDAKGMLNVEYRPHIAAGLGAALGVMEPNLNINAVLRWQRLAPPFSVRDALYTHSAEMLTDGYYYPKDPRSWIPCGGEYIYELVPAIMTRGCKMPSVSCRQPEKPFVLASKNPHTGAYAIATIRRNIEPNALVIVPADVTWEIDDPDAFVGIFGYFASLTLVYPKDIAQGSRIFAQNLLEDEAVDITDQVSIRERTITLPGRLLSRIGSYNYQNAVDGFPDPAEITSIDPSLLLKIIPAT